MYIVGWGAVVSEVRVESLAKNPQTASDRKMFNALAMLLLLVFVINTLDNYRIGQLQDMLWICHVSMLLLAVGMYARRQQFIQIAALWIFPGFIFWFVDALFSGYTLASAASHIIAFISAYYAMRRVGTVLGLWRYALLFWLLLQLLARWLTPASANVNIAYTVRPEATWAFDAYWQYWMFTCVAAMFGLWCLEKILHRGFQQQQKSNEMME